jgi:hypothetical protein
MEENKEAIEAQSKFRSEFLQVLSTRRPPQGTLQISPEFHYINRYVY